ncbi:MAG: hypothetical protein HN929_02010 [Chloroflexi bacterium]|jgi:hypothetical protein|nr:hypothetical protein [Chloroflexota bacterium]
MALTGYDETGLNSPMAPVPTAGGGGTNWMDWIDTLGKTKVNRNNQYLFANLASAINPKGMGGRVGEGMMKQIEGEASQEAFMKRMMQNKDFIKTITSLLSGMGVGGKGASSAVSALDGPRTVGSSTSQDWLKQNTQTPAFQRMTRG